jgi:hypothetical protein
MDITASPTLAPCGIPSFHGHKILIIFFRILKNVSGYTAIGVFLCLLIAAHTSSVSATEEIINKRDFHPFEKRDQNLFNLIHGQALPTSARLHDKSQASWSSSLIITNTLNIENNNDEDIYLDYEAYRFNLSYQYGLNADWNLKLDVPLIYQGGGFFDSAIDSWHQFFGMPRGSRPFVEDDQYDIQYAYRSQTLVDLDEASTSLGDIQVAMARSILDDERTNMSIWASLKLPTGNEQKLTGNGATDVAAWLALNQQLSDRWLLNMNAGVVILGTDDYKNIPLSDYALYGHAMLGWLVTDTINLKLQLQAHTSYYDQSRLFILGDTYFMTFGGTITINQCNQIDLAFGEDIKVEASPDASLIISWRHFTSAC